MKEQDLCCEEACVHPEHIEAAKSHMPDEDSLFSLAELFKVFSDSTRIRIMCALADEELCVCDIADLLGVSQSAISHQLRLLRASHLVRTRREGKSVFYSLDDHHVHSILREGLDHIGHTSKGREENENV
ncbi:MAG: metalloregulator ArsR/SmtB family transcription factor [Oscillospiraceae bacterium]|nr:metalloregulator ArsR/SmtB family transcription factor [Oscillospiraceae bacterium]